MKKHPSSRKSLRLAVAASIAGLAAALTAQAVPYASDVSNDGGLVTFRLNEDADNVRVLSQNGAVVNDLGAKTKGLHSVNLGIPAGHIKVAVSRSAPVGYTRTSADELQQDGIYVNKFEHPRGVVVNKNPATPSFGRIYVSVARQGTTAAPYVRETFDGIYMLNADNTIALGTGYSPRTAGIPFTTGTETASPLRLTIGKDDNLLYICDLSDVSGGLWQTDLDVTTNINVLNVVGDKNGATTNHGSIYAAAVEGSAAAANRKVYTVDEDLAPIRSFWRYDINGSPVPFEGAPTRLTTSSFINNTIDMVKGGSQGYIYVSQNRSAGTDGPSIIILDANGNLITNSLTATRAYLSNASAADLFRNTVAIDLSPDGSTLALLRGGSFGNVLMVPLVNGVFSFSGTNSFPIGLASDNNRELTFDAAGNIYIVSSSGEWLRTYSKGGSTTATTGTDGTFEVTVPPTTVSVAASPASIVESGTSTFTFTRSGDISAPLTVNYTVGGTADTDEYQPLAGSVDFAANATTATATLTGIDDQVAEFSETAIVTITPNPAFAIGTGSATVTITDNEPTEISVAVAQPTLLEFTGAKTTFQLTRKGLLSAVDINVAYTGTATRNSDFSALATVPLAANAATANVTVTALHDRVYEGNETIQIGVASGSYTVGSPSSATVTIVDDELPPGTVLFSDSLDVPESSANWFVNFSDGEADSSAVFGFDYSVHGIPEAPSSSGGLATRGLKMRVNQTSQRINGISASPAGRTFTGDYRLRFDIWMNYNGPLAGGGSGSSEHLNTGIGEAASFPLMVGGTTGDGTGVITDLPPPGAVIFSICGDGGFYDVTTGVGDLSVFAGSMLQMPATGVYAAGTDDNARGHGHPYYAPWSGGFAAPAPQVTAYPTVQTGSTYAGTIGFSWHTVTVLKQGSTLTWMIDGRQLANVSLEGMSLDQNVFVGYNDQLSSGTPTTRDMVFAIVDNVRVENLVAPISPVVTGIQLINGGTQVKITFTAGASDSPSAFSVVGASSLGASFADVQETITSPSAGQFEAVTPVSGSSGFYRIVRQ